MSALTSLLVRDGVVPVRKIEEALSRQVISGGDVETVLLEMGVVPENVLAAYRAAVYEHPMATREDVEAVADDVVALVPREVALEHRIVPMRLDERTLHLAAHEPLSEEQAERLGFLLGFELEVHVACEVRIAAALAHRYGAEIAPRMQRLVDRVAKRDAGEAPQVGQVARGELSGHVADLPDKNAPPSVAPPSRRPSRSGSFLLEPAPDEDAEAEAPSTPEDDSRLPAALRRHRGPLTVEAAERYLRQAADRDEIIEVFFAYADQFFDYTALFVVQDQSADGLMAHGAGAPTQEVRAISSPLDVPGGFSDVQRTRAPVVRALDRTDADRDLALAMRRPATPPAFLMPLAIRTRVVLILYGDRDGDAFDIGEVMQLVKMGPRVSEAFEQLIIRKKRAGYHDSSPPDPAERERAKRERDALKAAARLAREAGDVKRVPADSGAWKPGRISSPDGFAAPDEGAGQDQWGSGSGTARVVRERPTEPLTPEPARERAPNAILGIPRQAPPPPKSAELDLASLALDVLDDEEDDVPELTFDSDDGLELSIDDDGEEIQIEVGDDQDDEHEDEDDDDLADDDDEDVEEEDEDGRAPSFATPRHQGGIYSSREAPVDVVRPRTRSDLPPRPASVPPEPEAVRREPPPPEVVRVPDSIESNPPRPLPKVDAETRSVIVDMGEQVHAVVDDLINARDVKRQDELIRAVLAIGEAALPALAQAFPGPLTWEREQGGRIPKAGDLSPVTRALVAFGQRAAPYVGALLSSGSADVRLYASIVAGEMVSSDLMDPIAERIHDPDVGVRKIALQLLPRFAGFRGFDEIRTVLRRAARIRGRDLSRRHQAVDAVAALRDVEMIPKLIELLREDDEVLHEHLERALETLTGADLGQSPKKWQAWWERNRERHRIEWLIDALLSNDERIRRSAGEELKRLTQQYYGYHPGSPKRDRERIAKKYRDWWDEEGQRRFA